MSDLPDFPDSLRSTLRPVRALGMDYPVKIAATGHGIRDMDLRQNGIVFRMTHHEQLGYKFWTERSLNARLSLIRAAAPPEHVDTEKRCMSPEEARYALALAESQMTDQQQNDYERALKGFHANIPPNAYPDCKAHAIEQYDDQGQEIQKKRIVTFNHQNYRYEFCVGEPERLVISFYDENRALRKRVGGNEETIFAMSRIIAQLPLRLSTQYHTLFNPIRERLGQTTLTRPAMIPRPNGP